MVPERCGPFQVPFHLAQGVGAPQCPGHREPRARPVEGSAFLLHPVRARHTSLGLGAVNPCAPLAVLCRGSNPLELEQADDSILRCQTDGTDARRRDATMRFRPRQATPARAFGIAYMGDGTRTVTDT